MKPKATAKYRPEIRFELDYTHHRIPREELSDANRILAEEPMNYADITEAYMQESEAEARAELEQKHSTAEERDDELHIYVWELMSGMAYIDEKESERWDETIYYTPELTLIRTAPFDEASLGVLERYGIDAACLLTEEN